MLEERILDSEACFKEILEYVGEEDNERSIDEVESGVFNKLLELGQQLMKVFVAKQGRGYVGKTITVAQEGTQETLELEYHDDRTVDYLSIFGPIKIARSYYLDFVTLDCPKAPKSSCSKVFHLFGFVMP